MPIVPLIASRPASAVPRTKPGAASGRPWSARSRAGCRRRTRSRSSCGAAAACRSPAARRACPGGAASPRTGRRALPCADELIEHRERHVLERDRAAECRGAAVLAGARVPGRRRSSRRACRRGRASPSRPRTSRRRFASCALPEIVGVEVRVRGAAQRVVGAVHAQRDVRVPDRRSTVEVFAPSARGREVEPVERRAVRSSGRARSTSIASSVPLTMPASPHSRDASSLRAGEVELLDDRRRARADPRRCRRACRRAPVELPCGSSTCRPSRPPASSVRLSMHGTPREVGRDVDRRVVSGAVDHDLAAAGALRERGQAEPAQPDVEIREVAVDRHVMERLLDGVDVAVERRVAAPGLDRDLLDPRSCRSRSR